MFIEVLQLLQDSLNFTVKTVQPKDRQWGVHQTDPETGKKYWNGIVRMLIDGEADISTAGLTLIKERAEVIMFRCIFYMVLQNITIYCAKIL